MATPLLPTHARGHKQKGRGRGGAKHVCYLLVAFVIGYLVYVSWRGSPEAAEEDLQDDVGAKETVQQRLLASKEGVRPHVGAKHLERQDAMQRVQELQARHKQDPLPSPSGQDVDGSDLQAASSPHVPVNVEQHEEQHVPDTAVTSFFDLSAVDIDGRTVNFSQYRGKVVVVVNVASACGYTDQNYKGLQTTYMKYKDHGLEILGFPCNQFGGQEAKSESEIKAFCSGTYHVTFPMFSKVEVNGPNTHPVYKFLKQQLPASEGGGGGVAAGKDLGWNFFKFLVDTHGQPVRLFHQAFTAGPLEQAVSALLQLPAALSPDAGAATVEEHAATAQHPSVEAKVPEVHPVLTPSPLEGATEGQAAGTHQVLAHGPVDGAKEGEDVGTHQVLAHGPLDGATEGQGVGTHQVLAHGPLDGATAGQAAGSFFDLSAVDIDGRTVNFSQYKGRVLVVVNVASACGYTDQNYKGLERTYLKYKDHGLIVLGFPCNQFGGQESKSESEIKAFCSDTYHVTFPMFSKIEVNGPNTHPVYKFLKQQLPASEGGGGGVAAGKDLGWNFFKFLVDKRGQPVRLFHQELDVPKLQEEIYRLLHE